MDGYVLDKDIGISYFKWKHFDSKLLTQLVYIIFVLRKIRAASTSIISGAMWIVHI